MSYFWIDILLISLIYMNVPSVSCNNTTKEHTPEKSPAIGTSRLPTALQNFIINSTNLDEESTIVEKKVTENVKEVREPPEFEEPPKSLNRSSLYELSARPSNENYIAIGNHKLKSGGNLEAGFTPFIPSPPYIEETISKPLYHEDDSFKTSHFKSSTIVNHEHFYPPQISNNLHGEEHRSEYVNLPYSKFHHEKLPYITTFAPPKINPMQRPNLHNKGIKKYPHIHYYPEELSKTADFNEHDFHHDKFPADFHANDGFAGNGPIDGGFYHNYPHHPIFREKPYKHHGLWQILATLLPIGLFLSALQPKVILINATNPHIPPNGAGIKPFFRLDENIQNSDPNTIIYNLVENAGLTSSNDVTCNKLKICQAALNGSDTSKQSSFAIYSLWYLVTRSTPSIRKKLHLEDIFEAVQRRQCEQFSCFEETTLQKSQT